MNTILRITAASALLASLALAGCATTSPGYGNGGYNSGYSNASCYDCGTVQSIENVGRTPNATGAVLGGLVGAAATREIAKDHTNSSARPIARRGRRRRRRRGRQCDPEPCRHRLQHRGPHQRRAHPDRDAGRPRRNPGRFLRRGPQRPRLPALILLRAFILPRTARLARAVRVSREPTMWRWRGESRRARFSMASVPFPGSAWTTPPLSTCSPRCW